MEYENIRTGEMIQMHGLRVFDSYCYDSEVPTRFIDTLNQIFTCAKLKFRIGYNDIKYQVYTIRDFCSLFSLLNCTTFYTFVDLEPLNGVIIDKNYIAELPEDELIKLNEFQIKIAAEHLIGLHWNQALNL